VDLLQQLRLLCVTIGTDGHNDRYAADQTMPWL
jgi:hypothetical protein